MTNLTRVSRREARNRQLSALYSPSRPYVPVSWSHFEFDFSRRAVTVSYRFYLMIFLLSVVPAGALGALIILAPFFLFGVSP